MSNSYQSAVLLRQNDNDHVVSNRDEVESDNEENKSVLSEGEIGLDVARNVVGDKEEVESDKENKSVLSEGEIGLDVARNVVGDKEEVETRNVVGDKEEVESDKEENKSVLSAGEIGLDIARNVVGDKEEVESDKEIESVASVGGRMLNCDVIGKEKGVRVGFVCKESVVSPMFVKT
ncbi:Hypothetical predicted protein [Mytilus galloprovincialis]|uniref:Uncharacterized protein n=1 Tax=Mytilus galloprovincialis TaxID=29158 RepID=A0A8B6E6U2_MYTGA|nr:Hypothetical predicted protein [Mytilus galloprovincialis]